MSPCSCRKFTSFARLITECSTGFNREMDLVALPTARVRSGLGIIEATDKKRRRHWKENHVSYQLRPYQTDRDGAPAAGGTGNRNNIIDRQKEISPKALNNRSSIGSIRISSDTTFSLGCQRFLINSAK